MDAVGCRSRYLVTLTSLLSDGGIFIITSCNWTQDELVHHFTEGTLYNVVVYVAWLIKYVCNWSVVLKIHAQKGSYSSHMSLNVKMPNTVSPRVELNAT